MYLIRLWKLPNVSFTQEHANEFLAILKYSGRLQIVKLSHQDQAFFSTNKERCLGTQLPNWFAQFYMSHLSHEALCLTKL
jgi:hypothetical protein